tara:strand:+ start:2871 stop:3713 length:843 start_codon:yes stop_codon:yes gene_type:complete
MKIITPLVQIDDAGRIWGKLEAFSRTGSIKDRIVDYICDKAALDGKLSSDSTIIEASSGNTGIALASYAAILRCRCIIIMPRNMSQQRKDMMKAFGAEIIETGDNEFKEAIEMRDALVSKNGWFSPNQFSNRLNTACHYEETAPEIYQQLADIHPYKWGVFLHGAGTGGTMMGVKKFIDDECLDIKCVLVCPEEDAKDHGIQGINDGANFLLDKTMMSDIISISTVDAINRMKRFWRENGILVGISSGANILASERYLEKMKNPDLAIITILADRGERYL